MRLLAIDPGTSCGWALSEGPGPLAVASLSGAWDLRPKRHEGGGMRFLRLRNHLDEINPDRVVYEEVRRHLGTDAAHIYGGIVAVISSWCEQRSRPYAGVPVGTIKKHATGKGNASKEQMLESAKTQFGGSITSHDQADALWMLDWAIAEGYARE